MLFFPNRFSNGTQFILFISRVIKCTGQSNNKPSSTSNINIDFCDVNLIYIIECKSDSHSKQKICHGIIIINQLNFVVVVF